MKLNLLAFLVIIFCSGSLMSNDLLNPVSLTYEQNLKSLWVVNMGLPDSTDDGFIAEIYNDSTVYLNYLPGAKNPKSIVKAGSAYYLTDSCKIFKIENKFQTLFLDYHSKLSLYNMVYDGVRYIYITEQLANLIVRIDLVTKQDTVFILENQITKPCGICIDKPNNRLIITEFLKNGAIKSFDLTTYKINTLAQAIDYGYDIKQFRDGKYLVTGRANESTGAGSVYRINKDFSGTPEMIFSGLTTPSGMAINTESDELYIAETALNRVTKKIIYALPEQAVLDSPADKAAEDIRHKLSWFKTPGAENYKLQVSKDISFSSFVVDTTLSDISYQPYNLEEKTKYYWRVCATNKVGNAMFSETRSYTTNYIPQISVPVMILPVNHSVECQSVIIKWNSTIGNTYSLVVSKDSNFVKDTVIKLVDFSENSFTAGFNYEFGRDYYWKIMANYFEYKSPWSTVRHFRIIDRPKDTTKLTFPLNGSDNVPLDVEFRWNDLYPEIGNKEFYITLMRDSVQFSYPTQSAQSKFRLPSNMKPNKLYKWFIKPHINRCDIEYDSETWSFTTGNGNDVEEKSIDDIKISVNDNLISIETKYSSSINAVIFDLTGRKLPASLIGYTASGTTSYLLDCHPDPGLYFVAVTKENGDVQIRKFLIE